MSQQNLKKANQFALRGKIDEALPLLMTDYKKGDSAAAASLAQIAAFQGEWLDVIDYAEIALRDPLSLSGNVFDEMVKLMAVAGLKVGEWKRIETICRSIYDELMEKTDAHYLRRKYDYLFGEFFTLIKNKSHANTVSLSLMGIYKWDERGGEMKFKEMIKTLPRRKPKLFQDVDERKREVYALAKTYDYHLGAVELYLKEGLPSDESFWLDFDVIVFIASGLASVGKAQESWELIRSKLYYFWPVDYAQMEPVELFFDPHIRPLLTNKRCQEILKTVKGPEAEPGIRSQMKDQSNSVDGVHDVGLGYTLMIPFPFLGVDEIEVMFYGATGRLLTNQKNKLDDFLESFPSLIPAILKKIFEYYKKSYDDYREGWLSEGDLSESELEAYLPSPKKVKDLRSYLSPVMIYIPLENELREDAFGIEFDCTWDEAHGLGVLIQKGEVVEVGATQIAYL